MTEQNDIRLQFRYSNRISDNFFETLLRLSIDREA